MAFGGIAKNGADNRSVRPTYSYAPATKHKPQTTSRKRHKKIHVILFLAVIVFVIALAVLLFLYFHAKNQEKLAAAQEVAYYESMVETSVTCEAGGSLPELSAFLKTPIAGAKLATSLSAIDAAVPGVHAVEIDIDGNLYTSCLIVADTTPPQVTAKTVQTLPGEPVEAEAFVAEASDVSGIHYALASAPDYSTLGYHDVTLLATDASGNEARIPAKLLVSRLSPFTVEVSDEPIDIAQHIDSGEYSKIALSGGAFVPREVGRFDLAVLLDGQENITLVTVEDTTPPTAQGGDLTGYLNHPLDPEKAVLGAFDYSEFTAKYVAEPDWTKEGGQRATVALEDIYGNRAEYTSTITIIRDTEAPKIYGVKDRYCYIGKPVSYFEEAIAVDNCDGEIEMQVDKSAVNIYEAGTYPVTYTATDSSGNTATMRCNFTFVEEKISEEEIDQLAQEVLDEITTQDMSIGEKALAIFRYTNKHIRYTGSADKTDWEYEAHRGITEGRGDCFTFYSVAKLLLEKIGADTITVERYGGNRTTRHYWLLVDLGTGYYHFDAINVGPRNFDCFMRTDDEIYARARNFWSFKKDIYPKTPTTKYVMN